MTTKNLMLCALSERISSREVNDLKASLGGEPEIEVFEELSEIYWHFHNAGVSLLFQNNSELTCIFCYLSNIEGFDVFSGWIGDGVVGTDHKQELLSKLGGGYESGGGKKGFMNRYIHPWIKYHWEECSVCYDFFDEGNLRLVTFFERKHT